METIETKAAVISLNNPETARQYECTFTRDLVIHVPGHWKGLTSNTPPEIAEILIKQGHNAFVKKIAAE